NASASKPRIRNARISATTICSTKSRFVSRGFTATPPARLGLGLDPTGAGLFNRSEGTMTTLTPTDERTTKGLPNVADFPGIGDRVKFVPEHLERHRLARQVDEERLAEEPLAVDDRAIRPESRVVRDGAIIPQHEEFVGAELVRLDDAERAPRAGGEGIG